MFSSINNNNFSYCVGQLKTVDIKWATQLGYRFGYSKKLLYRGYLKEIFWKNNSSANKQQKLHNIVLIQI